MYKELAEEMAARRAARYNQGEFNLLDPAVQYLKAIKSAPAKPAPRVLDYKSAAAALWAAFRFFVQNPILDDETKKTLKSLARWIANDPKGDFSPDKGFLFMGECGRGKTVLLKSLNRVLHQANDPRAFHFTAAAQIFADVAAKCTDFTEYQNKCRLFDDIGATAANVRQYGNDLKIFDLILAARYDKFCTFGQQTHITTNLGAEQLKEYFDRRILDRLNEMCNICIFEGESFR